MEARHVAWAGFVGLAALAGGCAAGDGPGWGSSSDPGGGGGSHGGGDAAHDSGGGSSGEDGGGGGGDDGGAGGGGTVGNYAAGDKPDFKTAAELCKYVNEQREGYSNHDRFKGPPWSGSYHGDVTWPIDLAIDAALSTDAQAHAAKLALGAQPEGAPYSDGDPPPHEYLYVSGVDTASYVIASRERPGDWTPDMVGNIRAGITYTNGTARMALFYHDSGGSGPVLGRIGCGGAQAPGGGSWWWVVELAP